MPTNLLKNEIKKLEARLSVINQEKSSLENQLIGLSIAIKALSRHDNFTEKPLREGTEVALIESILVEKGEPLHLDEILDKLSFKGDSKKKLSLAGSLTNYVKQGKTFSKTAPNTFGLLKWEQEQC